MKERNIFVKEQMVAGCDNQRSKFAALKATSPTAALESVLLTAVIDAKEGRDVAIIDILDAFVQNRNVNDKDTAIVMNLKD